MLSVEVLYRLRQTLQREHGFGLLRTVGQMVLCGQRDAHDIALFGRHRCPSM